MFSEKKVEILAPAGSFESMHAAIRAGADAVYFGVEQLNMRARSAAPITIEDLPEIARICHSAGVKAYITLNTIMYDHDLRLLKSILKEVKQSGIDAVIASDMAAIQLCSEMEIPLHISTQANISNIEAVKFFARFADVVVLARELSLHQMSAITREIKRQQICGPSGELVKVEVFVHGALCMAISGKCYLSLHAQNASANRGACVQTCRRPYLVKDAETGEELLIDNEYIMSPKDLNTLPLLDQLIATGVDVLKIEGRSKGPEYVYTVTKCYKEAVQAIAEGSFSDAKVEAWMQELTSVYNRGFWEGYYLGRELGEWTPDPGSQATEKKEFIGKGVRYYPKIGIAEFLVEAGTLELGETIMITGPKFGFERIEIKELMVNGSPAAKANKGDSLTLVFPHKITGQEKLYKMVQMAHV